MATDFGGLDITQTPKTNTLCTQFYAVKKDATGVLPTAATTDPVVGFVQDGCTAAEATAGKKISVRVSGVTKAVAAGAIVPGAFVTPNTDGRVVTMAADTNAICGICLADANTAAGDVFPMLIVQSRRS